MNHYFSKTQESKLIFFDYKVKVFNNIEFNLISSSGIFSKDELDKASELLINNCTPKGKILDMGCGNGVIGISLLKKYKNIDLTFVDINERAVFITRKNLKKHSFEAKVLNSNLFEKVKGEFDLIVSNPPFSAGRKVVFELLEKSKTFIKPGGYLQVVARHSKGGKVIEQKMREIFGNVDYLKKGSGFRVYSSKKEAK